MKGKGNNEDLSMSYKHNIGELQHTFKVDYVPIPTYGCLGEAYWVKDSNLEVMLSLSLSLHTGVCN